MGLGNANPNQANKGSNFNFELRNLQLLANIQESSSTAGLATDDNITNIYNSINDLATSLQTYNTGAVATEIIAPVLPYEISTGLYYSYTIITSGSVTIDGVEVPTGTTLTWTCGSNETLTSKVVDTAGGGTVVITTSQKVF